MTSDRESLALDTQIRIWEETGGSKGRLVFDRSNLVISAGVTSLVNRLARQPNPNQTGYWYRQAIGSGSGFSNQAMLSLGSELTRASFTELTTFGRTILASSYLDSAFTCAALSVATATGLTEFTVGTTPTNEHLKLAAGDTLRIGLPSGYEYVSIAAITGLTITVSPALSTIPTAGITVEQMIEEMGLFGDESANYSTGTVSTTNGSLVVTGTGTAWNPATILAGEQIKIGNSRKWYTVVSCTATQITLATPFTEGTLSGQSYQLRGTLFSRVNGIRYFKTSANGLFLETRWTFA